MIKLVRFLFEVRHDYRAPLRTMRAQVMVPLSMGTGLLLLAITLVLALNVVTHRSSQLRSYTLIFLPAAWITCFLANYFIQHGWLQLGTIMIGGLLVAYNITDIMLSGSITTGVIFPMVVIFASLAFGTRGAVGGYLYVIFALIAMGVIRSNELFGTEPIEDLSSIVFFSTINLTVVSLMLWLFSHNLQNTLGQISRVIAQTRAAATTGQSIARILNMDELLTNAVELIRDRFAFYHVQIFVMDETQNYANLAASTGSAGHTLLAQGFRVAIGPRTVVGEAISTKETRHIPDITKTAYHHPPVLSDTRAQIVMPLLVGEDVVGALDVQSTRPNAFSDEDIEAMHIMANQVSQAIQNARLFEAQQRSLLQNRRLFLESETNLREIERLNRQLTGQSWQEYLLERGNEQFGVQLVGDEMRPGTTDWTPAMQQAAQRRRIVSRKEHDAQIVAVPINIRGEPVGAVEIQLQEPHNLSEARNLVQAVTERMAFSLENARLFEQARLAAEREQQINQITVQLQGLTSIEDVLTTAVDALAGILGAEHASVQLAARDIVTPAHDSAPENGPEAHAQHQGTDTAEPPSDDDLANGD